MTYIRYWISFSLISLALSAVFFFGVLGLGSFCGISLDHTLAYAFIILGLTVFYFGFLRPHWFAKEIIPPASPIKLKVKKEVPSKISLRDDSYFWRVFPYGLFFSVGGIAYLLQPGLPSLLVAFGCSAWVQFLYKFV